MSFAYLASPYTHPDPAVKESRYRTALFATARLLEKKIWVHSPIVHCHHLALEAGLPDSFDFWMEYNFAILAQAKELLVLRMDGTDESVGVRSEMKEAERLGIPWRYL